MFEVVLDGIVEEFIRATIAADPEFSLVQQKARKQKLFLMILENAVCAGFVSHSFNKTLCADVFISTPRLIECWSELLPSPLQANATDVFVHTFSGSRSRILGARWASKKVRAFVGAFFPVNDDEKQVP